MLIEIEDGFNPNVKNFYFDTRVLKEGEAAFASTTTAPSYPLLQNILSIGQIKELLLTCDMLYVQKEEVGNWQSLAPQIMAELAEFDFSSHSVLPLQNEPEAINALIEARIRPFLVRDGGNIELISFENGVLKVRLKGRCQGCPHATQTLKNTVEAIIKKYIPSVEYVQKEDEDA
ncbi:MAG: NifU family protein [Alphaproteobacteria bacterium]|nr:NifU family protein [Alphaproteobacteria bacterium]